jgi:hypothetical protein
MIFLKDKLLLLKQTNYWFFFLRYLFLPIFDFIWVNIVNFKGRLLAIFFLFKKKNFYIIDKFEGVKIIEDDDHFKAVAIKIRSDLSDTLLQEVIENSKYKKTNIIQKNKFIDFKISVYDFLSDETKEEIVNFALSDKNLVTATKYLKVLPIIKKIGVYINFPFKDKPRGSQLWHKDDFGYKSLDIFLAVSDINFDNGPLYFDKTINELGVFFKLKNVIKKALPGERNKVSLDVFSKYFNEDTIGNLIGKSGTGLFIDSFTKYHRGGFCKSKKRIMLRVSYQTPDSSRGNYDYDNKNFFYLKKIKKTDTKNIFFRHVLFGKRNFFLKIINIDKIILFLIKLFHYKK